MSLGRDLDQVVARMVMLAEGPTVRYGETKTARRPGESAAPTRVNSLAEEWARRVRATLEDMGADLEAAERGDRSTARGPRGRITARVNEGRDPTFVAFVEGGTTESVRRMRQRTGLDPDTGRRAPGAHTSRQLPEGGA